MSEIKYAHYMRLTHNAMHNALMKRNLPPETRQQIINVVTAQKEELRVKKIKKSSRQKLWDILLEPLRTELKSIRSSIAYKRRLSDERHAAFAAYETVLLKAFEKLRYIKQTYDGAPSEAAAEVNVPNKGEHWTDWIPDHKKRQVAELFDAIPHAPRAKRKVPFQRKIPLDVVITKLNHRRSILEGKLEGQEQLLKIYGDDERYVRLGHIQETQDRISDLKEKIREIDKELVAVQNGSA